MEVSLLYLTRWAVYCAVITLFFCFVAIGYLLKKQAKFLNFLLILAPALVCFFIVYTFYNYNLLLKTNPLMNDISTDYTHNINFYKYTDHNIKKLDDDSFSLQYYGGFKQPYKFLKPLLLSEDQASVFEKALDIMDTMNLDIIYINQKEGIIEAVDTSFWYGFKDDLVLRIETLLTGLVKIDARSTSRNGRSDFGVNAKRINNFMQKLEHSF